MCALCQAAATPWKGDSVRLKALLIKAVREWTELTGVTGATVQATEIWKSGVEAGKGPKTILKTVEKLLNTEIPACPLSYSPAEVERSDDLSDKLSMVDEQFDQLRTGIQLDRDGFVAHERYQDARAISEWTKKRLIEVTDVKHVGKYEYPVVWVFDDHDESGQFNPLHFDVNGVLHLRGPEGLEGEDQG